MKDVSLPPECEPAEDLRMRREAREVHARTFEFALSTVPQPSLIVRLPCGLERWTRMRYAFANLNRLATRNTLSFVYSP